MESSNQLTLDTPDQTGRYSIYCTTVLTSLLLLVIHKGIANDWSLFDSFTLKCIWYTSVIGTAFTLTLLINAVRSVFIWVAATTCFIVLAALANHTGNAYLPDSHLNSGSIFVPYTLCLVIALFTLVPFLQVLRDGSHTLSYPRLYQLSWDNGLTLLTATVFTVAGWLILFLLAGLFSVIGIDFFDELFDEIEFIYPVSGLFVGFGIGLGRSQIGAMRTALNVCLAIAKPLLPLICAISLLFLTALTFNNIQALWDTGRATVLLLCLVIGTILLLNAVYQDGENDKPYGMPMLTLVAIALLTLPVFSGIAGYAIYLRVDQYGWSVERLYAAFVCFFASLYALGYAATALHSLIKPGRWLHTVSRVNIVNALLLTLALLMSQSPLFDFRQITVNHQLSRAHTTDQGWDKLDLRYFRFELGAPGYRALLELAEEKRDEISAELRARIKAVLATDNSYLLPASHQWLTDIESGNIRILPETAEIPADLLNYLRTAPVGINNVLHRDISLPKQENCCYFIQADLTDNPEHEWVYVNTSMYNCRASVFSKQSGDWLFIGHMHTLSACNQLQTSKTLNMDQIEPVSPVVKNLRIGNETLHFQPSPKMP